jgi:5-methylcytosine-specific restriction endonuclease McrA
MSRASNRIPLSLQRLISQQARHRCGYCLTSEALIGMAMEFEHVLPLAAGGKTEEENLWLSCRRCNGHKGARTQGIDPASQEQTPLFNPRTQRWHDHFSWSENGTEIIGTTATGRATVVLLQLNTPVIVLTRRLWVSVGWWPPLD